MTVSSLTPEGDPFTCRVCGAIGLIEPSSQTGDAVCPRCGASLGRLLAGFADLLGGPVSLDTRLDALPGGFDSLDLVDLTGRLADDLGIRTVDCDRLSECETVGDLVRLLADLRDEQGR